MTGYNYKKRCCNVKIRYNSKIWNWVLHVEPGTLVVGVLRVLQHPLQARDIPNT